MNLKKITILLAVSVSLSLLMSACSLFGADNKKAGSESSSSEPLPSNSEEASSSEPSEPVSLALSEVSSVVSEPKSSESKASSKPKQSTSSSKPSSVKPAVSKEPVSVAPPTITAGELALFSGVTTEALTVLDKLDNKAVGWGLKRQKQGVRPGPGASVTDMFAKYNTVYIGENKPSVYLTFDCGYENGYTSKILDTLKKTNVKAVFFITLPYVKSNPGIVQRMIDEGHKVGNHSNNHPSMPSKDLTGLFREISDVDKYMLDCFDYKMNYFRPPEGKYSERSLAITNAMGYKTVLWSFGYVDYDTKKQPSKQKAVEMITKYSHPGCIFLLHAVSKANSDALADVIEILRSYGYSLELL